MTITATATGISASIKARRPSWADMSKHYPDSHVSTKALYDSMIGGKFKGLYNHAAYQNTCAVRRSYALNRSGLKMGKAPSRDGTVTGGDNFNYWIRVADLQAHLIQQFKGADEELVLPAIPSSLLNDPSAMSLRFKERVRIARSWLDTKLADRNGIVTFNVTGWGDASGHFTLWDGYAKKLAYAPNHDNAQDNNYYFWLTRLDEEKNGDKRIVQLISVKFWELK